ncbi:MAG: hypothetical protein ACTSYU_00520 [Promethearchaeota archaeon]
MKKIKNSGKKTLIVAILSFFFLIQTNILAGTAQSNNAEQESFSEIFRMENDSSRYYITDLDTNETWSIKLNASYKGIFYIFLFEERPEEELTLDETTSDPLIYDTAVAYNNTPSYLFDSDLNDTISNVCLDYTYTGDQTILFFLQIILVENGPDSFQLWSSKEIQPYYIPFIAGYSTIATIGGTVLAFFGIFFVINRKKHIKFTP